MTSKDDSDDQAPTADRYPHSAARQMRSTPAKFLINNAIARSGHNDELCFNDPETAPDQSTTCGR